MFCPDISHPGHFTPWMFCPDISHPGHFTPWMFCPDISHPGHFTSRTFHTPDISHPGHFTPRTFHIPGISHPGHFTSRTFHTLDISHPGHFIPWIFPRTFHTPDILHHGSFPGHFTPVTSTLVLHWLPCQAPGVIRSALGLAGPVSVYCHWMRNKFDRQLLSQCGSTYKCLSRSVPEIHRHVAGTVSYHPKPTAVV